MGACTGKQREKQVNYRDLVNYRFLIDNKTLFHLPYRVCLAAQINKNTHNLYDFEGQKQVSKKEIEVDFTSKYITETNIYIILGYISILDNDIVALRSNENLKNLQRLFDIECQDKWLKITQLSLHSDNRIWTIIRSSKTQLDLNSLDSWDIQVNDIIKLGRVRLQIQDYKFIGVNSPVVNQVEEIQGQIDDCISENCDEEGIQCRICFSRKATIANPLMSPCKCIGSVKYIHLGCLQSWIGMQIKTKAFEDSIQYIWKRMECEICKSAFRTTYTFRGQVYSLLKIPKPNTSYLIMNITNDEKGKEGMIYVLLLGDKKEFKMGRVPECEIKLKDISVSRQHAIMKLIQKENSTAENPLYTIRLFDNNSKFGTLVLSQQEKVKCIPIPECFEKPRTVYQIGRILVSVTVKPKLKYTKHSCYKHPQIISQATNINVEQIVEHQEEMQSCRQKNLQCSFQTNNELNVSDIVINEPKKGNQTQKQPRSSSNLDEIVKFEMSASSDPE